MSPENLDLLILSTIVFLARTIDVSIGTLRIIMVAKGRQVPAALAGFFECLIWLFAIGQIVENLTNPAYYLAFAGGFAAGTYVGISIEEKLAMGTLLVRIITNTDCTDLITTLRSRGHGVTNMEAQGMNGPVQVFYTVIKRSASYDVVNIIKNSGSKVFFTIEDVKFASAPLAQVRKLFFTRHHFGLRKSK